MSTWIDLSSGTAAKSKRYCELNPIETYRHSLEIPFHTLFPLAFHGQRLLYNWSRKKEGINHQIS